MTLRMIYVVMRVDGMRSSGYAVSMSGMPNDKFEDHFCFCMNDLHSFVENKEDNIILLKTLLLFKVKKR